MQVVIVKSAALSPSLFAAAVGATRTLRCSRARHHQHSEAAAPAQPADQEQAMQQQALYQQTASQVQSLDPAPQAQPRPKWACHKGNTILGVVRPFECVKVGCHP